MKMPTYMLMAGLLVVAAIALGDPGRDILLQNVCITTGTNPALPPRMTCAPSVRGTGLFLAQFQPPVSSACREALEEAGARVLGYVPQDAYLIEATPNVVSMLPGIHGVRWLGEFLPSYKLQPALSAANAPADYEVMILASQPADAPGVASAVTDGGGQVGSWHSDLSSNWIRARCAPALLKTLAARGDVQWIEQYHAPALHNDVAVQPGRMDVPAVWNTWGLAGKGQIIGHADTGLDVGDTSMIHTDFHGRVKAAFAWARPYNPVMARHEPESSLIVAETIYSGTVGAWDAIYMTPTESGPVGVIELMLSRTSNTVAEGSMQCRIHVDNGGAPGALLTEAISAPVNASLLTAQIKSWLTFPFTNMPLLNASTPYWIVLDCSGISTGQLLSGFSTEVLNQYHAWTLNGGADWDTNRKWYYFRASGPAPDWSDPDGHGTHTAGSILGDGAASTGQYRGVAYEAELVHQSLADTNGALTGLPGDLGDLFQQAYSNGARIHSDSWGQSVNGAYNAFAQQLDAFVWNHPDMLLVVSAGNEGVDENTPLGVVDPQSMGSPGTAKNSLTVGASENLRLDFSNTYRQAWFRDFLFPPISTDLLANCSWGMAAFSSRGNCQDGRIKPDVVAPGTFVISSRSRHPLAGVGWGAYNADYVYMGGTSMSTPLTAGAAALVRQFYMERKGMTNPCPSAALLKATIINGARTMAPGQYGEGDKQEIPSVHPNYVEGWGRVNLEETLFPTNGRRILYFDGLALETGQTNTFVVGLRSAGPLAVSLAYSDYPGTLGGAFDLVNDMDLLVVAPDGTLYQPNDADAPDHVNNVENTDVAAIPGEWTIHVSGYHVPVGPQPYALVISGDVAPVVECSARAPAAGVIELAWDTQKDFAYSVEEAPHPAGPWTGIPGQTNLPGAGHPLTVTNTLESTPAGFLRVLSAPAL